MIGQPPNLAKMQARDLKRYASLEWREWYSRPPKPSRPPHKPLISQNSADPITKCPNPHKNLLNGYGANIGNVRLWMRWPMEPMNSAWILWQWRKPRQYLSISGTEPFQAALNGIIESFGIIRQINPRHKRNSSGTLANIVMKAMRYGIFQGIMFS